MDNTFEEYIRQGEPDKSQRAENWQIAIGLQDVDGLKPSAYLLETAQKHNRHCHIRWSEGDGQSANGSDSKSKICTLNCTLEETAVLNFLKETPEATQKQIAEAIGKSERTVKTITVSLQQKGKLARKNGKRNGTWQVVDNE